MRSPDFCLPRSYFDEYRDACFETAYRDRVTLTIHLGCGRDKQNIFHRDGRPIDASLNVIGVDLDLESLKDYPGKLRVIANLEHLPFADETFGLAASEEVFEHIQHPRCVTQEISRVLVGGGVMEFCTPNKYSYVSILAKVTPLRIHHLVQAAVNPDKIRKTDVFKKYYRLNSKHDLDAWFIKVDMECVRFKYWNGGPWMLRIHPVLVRFGLVYHRIVRRFRSLSFLSNTILGTYRKHLEHRVRES